MQQLRSTDAPERLLPVFVVAFLLGASVALLGSYWDDAWHTNRGRDDFLIAPHLLLYAGVLLSGGALGSWAGLALLRGGRKELSRNRPLALAAVAVAATLAAAPIDNAWHEAFGRDAVLWSPPHALGVIGLLGLSVAMMALLARSETDWAAPARFLTSGLVLAGAVFLVAEYETDVPQFAELLYLPVLATAAALALELVRLTTAGRWPASTAATAHLGLLLLVTLFLTVAVGWEAPLIPLLVGPAVALDLATRRSWSLPARSGAFVATLYALYVPYLAAVERGPRLDGAEVLLGAPLALIGVNAILALVGSERGLPSPPASGRATVTAATIAILLLLPLLAARPAGAHDPGQGEQAGTIDLRARVIDERARLRGRIREPASCQSIEPAGIAARRAGTTVRAPLEANGCELSGSIELPEPGRWFLYAELSRADERLEAWLPVEAGAGSRTAAVEDRSLYAPAASGTAIGQAIAAVLLYGVCLALLIAIVELAKRSRPS